METLDYWKSEFGDTYTRLKQYAKFWCYTDPIDIIKGYKRVVSLGSWCHLKAAYCKKHHLYAVHRRGHKRLIPTDTVLIHEMNKPITKGLALQYRDKYGAELVGFEHGHLWGRYVDHLNGKNYSYVDKFVVEEIGKDWWKHTIKIPIESIKTNYYSKLKSRPGNKVFLMGFPFPKDDVNFYANFLPDFDPVEQRKVHQAIIAWLIYNDIPWVYKAHPLRVENTKKHLNIPDKNFETRLFDKVHHQASMFIHTTSDSTTFGPSLYMGKPVILIDWPGHPWVPEALEWTKKRCLVIPKDMISWHPTCEVEGE